MVYKYLIIGILLCAVPFGSFAQDVKERVQNYLADKAKFPYELFQDDDAVKVVVKVAKENLGSPDPWVRRKSYRLASKVGLRCNSPELKSEVLDILLNATVDTAHNIREANHTIFALFPKHLFGEDFKKQLAVYLNDNKKVNITHVLLAGYLDMHESKGRLESLAAADENDFPNIVFYTSTYRKMDFSAHLALARLGEEKSIRYVLDGFRKEDKRELVIKYLSLLAYVKQPESLDYMIEVLNTDGFIGGGDVIRESYGGRVIKYLIPMVDGFPIEENSLGLYYLDQVEEARAFMKSNQGSVKINRNVW